MQVLLVIQILLAAALIGMVLVQRSDSDGMGLGGGGNSGFMTGRAVANFMTRTTAILAAAFIINSLALSVLASRGRDRSIVDTIMSEQTAPVNAETAKASAPQVPVLGDAKSSVAMPEKTSEKPDPSSGVKEEKKLAAPVVKKSIPVTVTPPAPQEAEEVDHNAMPATPAAKQ